MHENLLEFELSILQKLETNDFSIANGIILTNDSNTINM